MIDLAEVINSGEIFRDKMISALDRDELIKSCEIFRDKMLSALTGKGKQIMIDRQKVIKGLEHCDIGGSGPCYENDCPYYQSHDCTDELKNDILVLLKEQEAVEPRVSTAEQRCGHCNKVIEMDGWQSCPWCGKRIDWKGWWKKNGTRNQDT